MSDFDLDRFTPYRLAMIAQKVSRGFERRYRKHFGISIAEWRIIAHLSQASEISIRDLQDRVGLDKSQVSRATARLERAGIVSKRTSDTDKRLLSLSLTGKGRGMMENLTPLALDYEADLLGALTKADQAALDRALTLLAERLK